MDKSHPQRFSAYNISILLDIRKFSKNIIRIIYWDRVRFSIYLKYYERFILNF
jgi:hypothetical protein